MAARFLPRGGFGSQWLYVLERANGRVKVGRTGNPHRRFGQHLAAGVIADNPVTRFHLFWSVPRPAAWHAERRAIDALANVSTRVGVSEDFVGIAFEHAVAVVRATRLEA